LRNIEQKLQGRTATVILFFHRFRDLIYLCE
jgi:hypothetical protein